MSTKPLEINSKELRLMKPVTNARYDSKTVLTSSSWEFVELWLKRQKSDRAREALFFWTQAQNFYKASECLPIESRPLTSYYCCLNAAKALLSINGPSTLCLDNMTHGITSDRNQWKNNNIKNAEVIFLGSGVLCELSKYFKEEINKRTYSVYDLLYNIPCVHRSFAITYNSPELFIPVREVGFIVDTNAKKGWVQLQVDERYSNGNSLKFIPKKYERVTYNNDRCLLRSKKRFNWDIHGDVNARIESLSNYHSIIRKNLHYIYGESKLWYLKKELPANQHVLDRNSVTLIFAVMHWLSELVRYNPQKFEKLMGTKQNWLIHEFVDIALYHFVDEVSCEMTKVDIMTNGYRK